METKITIDEKFLTTAGDKTLIGTIYNQTQNVPEKDDIITLNFPTTEASSIIIARFVIPSIIRDILWLQARGCKVVIE